MIYLISSDITYQVSCQNVLQPFFLLLVGIAFRRRAVVRCQGEDRADTFSRMTGSPLCHLFHLFFVSVGVWDVDGNATPCFLPQSQTYRNEKPSQLKSEDCKGCICPLYGGQDLIFFNNLYEPPISRFDMFAILSAW